jgi:mono/diheme cytochrome c family protein
MLVGLALAAAAPAPAQDNRDKGRTAQQIFNTNCAICHRSPQGLGMALGSWTLPGFLTQHYTTSRATADVLARYLASVNRGRESKAQRPRGKRPGRRNTE